MAYGKTNVVGKKEVKQTSSGTDSQVIKFKSHGSSTWSVPTNVPQQKCKTTITFTLLQGIQSQPWNPGSYSVDLTVYATDNNLWVPPNNVSESDPPLSHTFINGLISGMSWSKYNADDLPDYITINTNMKYTITTVWEE